MGQVVPGRPLLDRPQLGGRQTSLLIKRLALSCRGHQLGAPALSEPYGAERLRFLAPVNRPPHLEATTPARAFTYFPEANIVAHRHVSESLSHASHQASKSVRRHRSSPLGTGGHVHTGLHRQVQPTGTPPMVRRIPGLANRGWSAMYRPASSSTHRATGPENPGGGQNLRMNERHFLRNGQGILTGSLERVSHELFIIQQQDRQPNKTAATRCPPGCHRLTCPGEIFKSLQGFIRLP